MPEISIERCIFRALQLHDRLRIALASKIQNVFLQCTFGLTAEDMDLLLVLGAPKISHWQDKIIRYGPMYADMSGKPPQALVV